MRTVRPTRSGTGVAAALVAAALLLTACGSDSSASPSAAPDTSRLVPEAEGKVTYPLTLETRWGDVVLEKRPERIVSGDDWEIDLLAALRVTPVGTNDQLDFRAYATKLMNGKVESTWSNEDVFYPAEPILATNPDLIDIVGSVDEPDNLDALSSIAPVLGPPPGDGDEIPWQDRLRQLGKALDLSDRAEKAIQDNTAHFAKLRADHPEFAGKTAVFLNFWGKEYGTGYLSTPGSGSTTLFTDLGFAQNPDAARFADVDTVSAELLSSIKGDVILVNDGSGDPAQLRDFLTNPLFQRLDAVKNDRLVVIANPGETDVTHDGQVVAAGFGHFGRAIGGSGPVPQQAIAGFLVPLLSETLSG